MTTEQYNEHARKVFNRLEMPVLKYGLGIQVYLKDLNLNQAMGAVNDDEKMTIHASRDVNVLYPSALDPYQLEEYFAGLVTADENKFMALHYAILNDTRIIVIPRNMTIKEPIMIRSQLSKKTKAESIIVIAEEASRATIIDQSFSTEDAYYKSHVVQVYAKNGAHLTYCSLQNNSEHTYTVDVKRGKVERDATIQWHDVVLGGKVTQLHMRTILNLPGAQSTNTGVYLSQRTQQFDISSETVHKAKHTESVMHHRGVLGDTSRVIYRGLIQIEKDSSHCTARQKTENLLIGDQARCDAVPKLEVKNDQVVCSHGATISHVNEDVLFYLTSRGLDEDTAQKIAIIGFLEPVIRGFPESLHQGIREAIGLKLNLDHGTTELLETMY